MEGKARLSDVLELPRITALFEALRMIHGETALAIMDRDNNMLVAVGFQDICVRFHRQHPATEARCVEASRLINERIFDGPYTMYECPNGIIDIAFPIVIEGDYLGTFWIGQILVEPPDRDFFLKQAQQHGFDSEEYLAALRRVPVVPLDEVERQIDFYRKLVDFIVDLGLKNRLLAQQNEVIRAQSEALRELSAPILEVWDDVLVLPIIGSVDARRSAALTSDLLEQIVRRAVHSVLIDVTGMTTVDAAAAQHLVDLTHAARLVGARCMLTGIGPEVARTLAAAQVDLGSVPTLRNLKAGLKTCLEHGSDG